MWNRSCSFSHIEHVIFADLSKYVSAKIISLDTAIFFVCGATNQLRRARVQTLKALWIEALYGIRTDMHSKLRKLRILIN